MSGSGGGLATVTTLLRQLVNVANAVVSAIYAAAPVTSSHPANQFLASPSGSAGTPAFRAITQADLGAVQNALPFGATNATTGTSVAATTALFAAPSDGTLMIQADGTTNGVWSGVSFSTSAGGLVILTGLYYVGAAFFRVGYLPMSTGQTTTATVSASTVSAATTGINITCFFLPLS